MDLYVTSGAMGGGSVPSEGTTETIKLSRLLRKLGAYPPKVQSEKYRSPNGVSKKLGNLRAVETNGAHGMNSKSGVDSAVWRDYVDDLASLHAEAEAIRLRLQDGTIQPAKTETVVEDVEIEQQHTETFVVNPSGELRTAERAEQELVIGYRNYMAAKGIVVGRKRYRPAGEVRPIYCDVWVKDRNALIEAKNSDSRDAIRQAIGQLYDYRRFHRPPPRLAVLLPRRPTDDRLVLLRSAGIEAVWPRGAGFSDSAHRTFV